MDTILTCDNGIAAISEIAHAKELGMTVLVTDHHEIPYIEENGEKQFLRSNADAVVNPKQRECAYPFKELCGAAVAWKVLQVLYEKMGFAREETYEFLENVAFATVGDVMDLTDENRILVKEGLKCIRHYKKSGYAGSDLSESFRTGTGQCISFWFCVGTVHQCERQT